jgi:hypothetical protein
MDQPVRAQIRALGMSLPPEAARYHKRTQTASVRIPLHTILPWWPVSRRLSKRIAVTLAQHRQVDESVSQ